jgi:hypothetical protein
MPFAKTWCIDLSSTAFKTNPTPPRGLQAMPYRVNGVWTLAQPEERRQLADVYHEWVRLDSCQKKSAEKDLGGLGTDKLSVF